MLKPLIMGLSVLALSALFACAHTETASHVQEPVTYKNLSVYMITDEVSVEHSPLLTLSEGLASGLVTVHETGSVGELSVENNSDRTLFISAGEIVKGGRQDRVLRQDMLVAAGSDPEPLAAFCVERGRWTQRGKEVVDKFLTSNKMAPTKELKMAAKVAESQTEVWAKVDKLRFDLEKNARIQIRGGRSTASAYLLLEDTAVATATSDYLEHFRTLIESQPEAVGFAYAIGSEMNSAEIYASRELFEQLWPKLIEAAVVEAAAAYDSTNRTATPSVTDVERWLEQCDAADAEQTAINDRTSVLVRESDFAIGFETLDAVTNVVLHRSYIHK